MAKFTQETLDRVRQRADLCEVVGAYVGLKAAGGQYRGLSPFNPEKTPSFYVLPQKGIFKCFSSGEGGDVFAFIQKMENMNFQESVEHLAQRFSIPLEYEKGSAGPSVEQRSLRRALEQLHVEAVGFFHKEFLQQKIIQDYWQNERGFRLETAKAFQIGFAPVQPTVLAAYLKQKGFNSQELGQSGLFYTKDTDPHYFKCRFRGRLMIPIADAQGRVIAFTGRQTTLTPKEDPTFEAKYINSAETPIFKKGQVLFGLQEAKKGLLPGGKSIWPLIMVEGQLDALRLWECGIATAVAPQGTAVTPEQLLLIKRYTNEFVCFLDGDTAGQKAALRLLPLALEAGLEPRFLTLPQGSDPDAWLRAHGTEGFAAYLKEASSPIAFATQAYLTVDALSSATRRQTGLEALYAVIALIPSAIWQQSALEEVARGTRLPLEPLEVDFKRFFSVFSKRRNTLKMASEPPSYKRGRSQEKTTELLTNPEFELLFVFLHHEDLAQRIAQAVDPQWVRQDRLWGVLLKKLLSAQRQGLWQGPQSLEALGLEDSEKQHIYTLLAQEGSHLKDHVYEAIRALFVQYCKLRLQEINLAIEKEDPTRLDLLNALQKERVMLRSCIQNPTQFIETCLVS